MAQRKHHATVSALSNDRHRCLFEGKMKTDIRQLVKKVTAPVRKFFHRLWNGRHVIGDLIRHKHRFVVLDTETYKEKVSFVLSGLNVFVVLGLTALVLVVLTAILLAFTPLREFIPGYTNTAMTEQTYRNARTADSLAAQLRAQEDMLNDIQDIMLGKDPGARHVNVSVSGDSAAVTASEYTHSHADSLLRAEVEGRGGDVNYVTPVKGRIKRKYNPSAGFPAVEVLASAGADVKAVQSGIVLWSFKDDNGTATIVVEHPYGVHSLYRFEGKTMKEAGDEVSAGEQIAKISPQKRDSDPMLHFEMRKNGEPVNPGSYIKF